MNNFNFSIPQNIHFGVNSVDDIGSMLVEKNITNILIISDYMLEKLGMVERIGLVLDIAGLTYSKFVEVEANPSVETVNKALSIYKKNQCCGILALGGGSPMDVAKAVGVLAEYGGEITDYEGAHKVPGKIVPLIAVPTTAGTGSEVTAFSVITDKKRHYKLTVFSYELIPEVAVLDPTLITTLPASIAAATGIDALVHAVEAYLSKAASPFSEAMSEKAIQMIGENIEAFVADRGNIEAASNMIMASSFAGIAFAWARLGNVHAMAHPLGGYFNVPHGIANAILLPKVLEFNAGVDEGKYQKIYHLMTGNYTEVIEASGLIDYIEALLERLNIPKTLNEVGVNDEKTKEMAIDAMKSGNIQVNPRTTTIDDITMLYQSAMG